MKRLYALVTAAAITFTLAGCGKQQKAQTVKDTEILSANSDTDKVYQNVFEADSISEVRIDIPENDWTDLCDNAIKEEFYQADVTVNGTTVKNAGFRAKGNSTLRSVANSDSDRYSFKIKFDKYVDDQTLNGLDMMVLNSSFADPSYMREYLAYAASSSIGAVTPFLSYSKLYINNEYYGLYVSIESYKDSFVNRLTSDKNAVLYKADGENCTLMSSDDTSGFEVEYGKDKTNENVKKLIEILNSTDKDNYSELEKVLDVDSVLKAMAINMVTGNYDSYSGSKAHNYYLLYADGKFSYIGWDYNMAFGGFVEDSGSSVTTDTDNPFFSIDSSKRPLMSKLLEIDEYKNKYESYVSDLKAYFTDFESKINTIADFIRDDVKTDPTAFYSIDKFEENIVKSDTDLSQVKGNGQKGQKPQLPDGQEPSDGQRPQLPDGQEPSDGQRPQFPDGQEPSDGQKPQLPDGQEPSDGQRPQLPDGQEPSDGQRPQLPDGQEPTQMPDSDNSQSGEKPQLPDGNTPGKNKNDGMLNTNTVSIYDYIEQKLAKLS